MSTDEETLEKLAEDDLPRTILDYRTLNKLKNTYIDQLPDMCIQAAETYIQHFIKPEQQQDVYHQKIRIYRIFQYVPVKVVESAVHLLHPELKIFLISADYSQIELRVVAHFSKDPTFLDAYRRNLDIHSLTASTIYGVEEKDVTREMRDRAKEVNFGLIYRMGAERLSIVTKTSKAEAKEFIERYFEKYSTIHALQERFLEQARKEGFSETLFGRRRYLT